MDPNLDGKVAWVTGASGAIGRAIAVALAEQGAQTVLTSLSDIPASDVLPCEVYRAPIRTPKTCDRLDQLILAVPGYPGDSQNLASSDGETDITDNILTSVRSDCQILHCEHRLRRMRHAAIYRELDFTTNHERGQVILVGLRWLPRSNHLAAADDSDPVSDL